MSTATQTVTPEAKLQRKLGSISNLPTLPLVFTQIQRVINDSNSSIADVGAILKEDPAMSVKVLRLSNSAFFGTRNEITQIKQAILVLGLDVVRSLVLSSSVFDMFKDKKLDSDYQESFWRHSVSTAFAAKMLANFRGNTSLYEPEVSFSAGLLHDIGKLIMCCYLPEDHQKVTEFIEQNHCSQQEAENQLLDYDHAVVGKVLAVNWKLPETIQNAIALHHDPPVGTNVGGSYATITHVADYVSHRTFSDTRFDPTESNGVHSEVLEMMSLDDEAIEALSHKLLDEYAQSQVFMQMALSA